MSKAEKDLSIHISAIHKQMMETIRQMEKDMIFGKRVRSSAVETVPVIKKRRGRERIEGQPHGRVVHKMTYSSPVCERYLVVTPNLWVEIDDEDNVLTGEEVTDYYGQLHWESQCHLGNRR